MRILELVVVDFGNKVSVRLHKTVVRAVLWDLVVEEFLGGSERVLCKWGVCRRAFVAAEQVPLAGLSDVSGLVRAR